VERPQQEQKHQHVPTLQLKLQLKTQLRLQRIPPLLRVPTIQLKLQALLPNSPAPTTSCVIKKSLAPTPTILQCRHPLAHGLPNSRLPWDCPVMSTNTWIGLKSQTVIVSKEAVMDPTPLWLMCLFISTQPRRHSTAYLPSWRPLLPPTHGIPNPALHVELARS
jgi:hypothetical protein